MHSIKYGLIKVCVKTSKHQLIKVSNNPIGLSKTAIKMHQIQLYERPDNKVNVFEKFVQELPNNLPDENYNIHLQNINYNRMIFKELDVYEIYKMERLHSEFDTKTKDVIVINNNKTDDENLAVIALAASIGSIFGMCVIFGIYTVFD